MEPVSALGVTGATGATGPLPDSYTGTPTMDGLGAAGSSDAYARGDHQHPTDANLALGNVPNVAAESTISIQLNRHVHRVNAQLSFGTAYYIPLPDASGIGIVGGYFCFEIEAIVPAGASAISMESETGWTWVDGGDLPTADFAGKTIYIAARLNCLTRTFLANVWRVA